MIGIQEKLLLITTPGKEHESVLRLARVGYENVAGYLEGGIKSWAGELASIQSLRADQLKSALQKNVEVIDVRKPSEWAISHMKDAKFIPLSDMPVNLAGLDKNKCYYVHCGGGYRSMTAISLMKREGFKELHNVQGGFRAMMDAGLKIVTEEVPA